MDECMHACRYVGKYGGPSCLSVCLSVDTCLIVIDLVVSASAQNIPVFIEKKKQNRHATLPFSLIRVHRARDQAGRSGGINELLCIILYIVRHTELELIDQGPGQ